MLQEKVLNTIFKNELIKYGDTIVIGVSGGPDSITLLHVLTRMQEKLGIKIVVCHVNHMLRPEAIEEENYVKNYCTREHIKCYVKRISVEEVAKQEKIGTEEAGRKIRYAFFEEIAKKEGANKIATAHTANDNAETILLHLFRGTGIAGLRGIAPIRNERYIHPLLECTREEIEQYCMEHHLEPKIDSSNDQNIYARNKIRNIVIPYVKKEYNPNIIETLNRLGELAKEETNCIQKETVKLAQEIVIKQENEVEVILDLKKFNNLEEFWQKQLILYAIYLLFRNNARNRKKTYRRYSSPLSSKYRK